MPSKTPHRSGSEPVEHGDVEMKDDAPSSLKGKGKKVKDGDEEMTVVVPTSKSSKLTSSSGGPVGGKDKDGDVAMEGEVLDGEEAEEKIDPVLKAVNG
jgi:26S proteasome regulatory subunit N3